MNKEHIRLSVKELQEKIVHLDELLFADEEVVSALDLDTQLMHLRMLYDTYLLLRLEGKKKGKSKKEKEIPDHQAEEIPESEEIETSLPLLFTEEVTEVPKTENMSVSDDSSLEENSLIAEETDKVQDSEKEEIPRSEEVSKLKVEEKIVEENVVEENLPVIEESLEVDLDLLEDPKNDDFDLESIEFEDEPDPDPDDEMEETPIGKKEIASEEEYIPYYPGLNPKAMDGEPEVGYANYASGKSSKTLGDHFVGQFPSLNDQLSQKKGEDRSLGSRKQKDQIHDLTKSIDLNLKFTFVRELFKGDARLLTEELNTLNQCGRLETALSTFEDMKKRYHWKEGKEAVEQLYELILRKYAR